MFEIIDECRKNYLIILFKRQIMSYNVCFRQYTRDTVNQ